MSDSDATLIGNLTRDPEMQYTPSGKPNTKFGIAVNRRWKQGDEWKEEASFFNVQAWGTLAENVAASLKKGNRVVVMGRFQQRIWKKDDNTEVNMVELVAEACGPDLRWATCDVQRVERDAGGSSSAPSAGGSQQSAPAADASWNEEPF